MVSGERCVACGTEYPEGCLYDVETAPEEGGWGVRLVAVCGPCLDAWERGWSGDEAEDACLSDKVFPERPEEMATFRRVAATDWGGR